MIHWTTDDDLVRDYLLGLVKIEVKLELEAHLSSCPACRERIAEEQSIALGVRQYALFTQKEQLRALTGAADAAVPWPRILSIAALLVIIAGIGVYNRWFFGPGSQPGLSEPTFEQPIRKREGRHPESESIRKQETGRADGPVDASKNSPAPLGLDGMTESDKTLMNEKDDFDHAARPLAASPPAAGEPAHSVAEAFLLKISPAGRTVAGSARAEGYAMTESKESAAERQPDNRIVILHPGKRRDSLADLRSSESLSVQIEKIRDTLHLTIHGIEEVMFMTAFSSGDSILISKGDTTWGLRMPEKLRTLNDGGE